MFVFRSGPFRVARFGRILRKTALIAMLLAVLSVGAVVTAQTVSGDGFGCCPICVSE